MDTKFCNTCKRDLPIDEFYVHRRRGKVGRQSMCKSCASKRRTEHYLANKEHEINVRNTRANAIRKQFVEYKQNCSCVNCGEDRWYVLEFHHIDEKIEAVSVLVSNRAAWNTILNEIEKCDVLCANCHKEVHHLEKNFGVVAQLVES